MAQRSAKGWKLVKKKHWPKGSIAHQVSEARTEGELAGFLAWLAANEKKISNGTVKKIMQAYQDRKAELAQEAVDSHALSLLSNQA